MKKTLIALAVTAFAASATATVELYNQEGSVVSLDGHLKVVAQKETSKTKGQATQNKHSKLYNDGSRLGLNVKHNITEDFYGFGRLELRLNGTAANDSDWGDVYARRAFVGLGHKAYGEVAFGKQALIGDSIGRIGLDETLGVGSDYSVIKGWKILNQESDSAVRYNYNGVQGLTLSADYSFANEHETNSAQKAGYGLGAIYEFAAGEGTASVSLGYGHKDFETGTKVKKDQDGVYGGFNYVINNVKIGVDGGYGVTKVDNVKNKLRYIRTGLRYDVEPNKVGVYGNYSYNVVTLNDGDNKNTAHRFMLGTDYQFHKHVKVFLEGRLDKARLEDRSGTTTTTSKVTDKAVAVGLKVLW